MAILMLIGMIFMFILELFHARISLNSVMLMLLVNFVSGFTLVLMFISLIVSVRSSLSSPWFSGAFGDFIVHRNDFFVCSSRMNFLHLNMNFRNCSNHCKRVLEAAKLAYANKARVYRFPEPWLI